ncbi:hypothetical protein FocTR4_00005655 [Fusarium oxysporum f. sp. cubense]|uniref:Uncharacterized protein n=1 Tax=Fusarium oxysporum f. sp. cubense TaxID=61366 RepID=A0A5C6TEZ0_FUSOC|nr:hypothetical protein FocTR4_00005655 [Fusarium oxysporum f. sp. cubense]
MIYVQAREQCVSCGQSESWFEVSDTKSSEAQETQKCGGSGINNCLVLILQGAGSSTHNTQRSYTSLV